ncbi:SURF1 family protein [Aeromicrobium sp. UC242_57]|uniref:SURF1 family protein n=1 Tax=Aeromicrobium sp. UC242_57 TaxID=3374624 RepID=UPI0037B8A42D
MTGKPALRSWFSPGLIGLHVFAIVAVVFCVVMGLWQAGAYDDRQHHEQADKRVVPTVAFESLWVAGDPFLTKFNHRPVTVDGEFAPADQQVWVSGKELDGRTGAWLLAPFMVDGTDDAVMVLRGWAPETGDLPDVPSGALTVDGVLEPGESADSGFDDTTRTIGSVRIPALINVMSFDLYSGFVISTDENLAAGLELVPPPQPDDVSWTVGLRNLAYALQWWVFGLFAAFMWWRMTVETARASERKVA